MNKPFMSRSRVLDLLVVLAVPVCGCLLWWTYHRPPSRADIHAATHLQFHSGPVFADREPEFRHDFRVTNPAARTVRILELRPGCECTRTTIDTRELPPHGHTTLHLCATMRRGAGLETYGCTLRTDLPEVPEWDYFCTVPVYLSAVVEPDRIELGVLNPRQSWRAQALVETFAPPGDQPAVLSDILSDDHSIWVSRKGSTQTSVLADRIVRSVSPLSIELRAGAEEGEYSQTATIKLIGRAPDQLTVPVSWTVRGLVTVKPGYVFFGQIKPGDAPMVQRVILFADHPFQVTGIRPSSTLVGAREVGSVGALHHVLELRLDSKRLDRTLTGEVAVHVKGLAKEWIKIPFAALPLN